MKFGSLFAGIGGFDLGLERAGMECAWQVEIDDYCNKVLAKHWPEVKRYRDVREVHGIMAYTNSKRGKSSMGETLSGREETKIPNTQFSGRGANGKTILTPSKGKKRDGQYLEPVELICGGFPCQPHSVAGKRKGAADDRNLWPEYLRIIKEVRPSWVIGENVPGIITTMLDQVLSDLESAEYAVETLIIPACAFNAPHRRDRVWVIAFTDKNRCGYRRSLVSGRHGNMDEKQYAEKGKQKRNKREREFGAISQDVANPIGKRRGNGARGDNKQRKNYDIGSEEIGRGSYTPDEKDNIIRRFNQWQVEPGMGRVANGVPRRVDRLRALGNAVVPQVAEYIGRCIMEAVNG